MGFFLVMEGRRLFKRRRPFKAFRRVRVVNILLGGIDKKADGISFKWHVRTRVPWRRIDSLEFDKMDFFKIHKGYERLIRIIENPKLEFNYIEGNLDSQNDTIIE